jgi:hypothetical protein
VPEHPERPPIEPEPRIPEVPEPEIPLPPAPEPEITEPDLPPDERPIEFPDTEEAGLAAAGRNASDRCASCVASGSSDARDTLFQDRNTTTRARSVRLASLGREQELVSVLARSSA